MARQSPGGIVAPTGKRRSWAIRFRDANGKRHTVALGTPDEGGRASGPKTNSPTSWPTFAGGYEPRRSRPPSRSSLPPIGRSTSSPRSGCKDVKVRFASAPASTIAGGSLSHLLPDFADPAQMPDQRLSAITVEDVDRYRRSKVAEAEQLKQDRAEAPEDERGAMTRPLSNGSINKTIRLLATILDQAVEYGHVDRNPAAGRNRLLREPRPSRSYLQPDPVDALLVAAGVLDAEARDGDTGRRRLLLAVLALAGLRIGEALDLRWRDVNLGGQSCGSRPRRPTPESARSTSPRRCKRRSRSIGPEPVTASPRTTSSRPPRASATTPPTSGAGSSEGRSSGPTSRSATPASSRSLP